MMRDDFIAGIDLNQFPAGLPIFMLLLYLVDLYWSRLRMEEKSSSKLP